MVIALATLIAGPLALRQNHHRPLNSRGTPSGGSRFLDTQIQPRAFGWPSFFGNSGGRSGISAGAIEEISALSGQLAPQNCLSTWQGVRTFALNGEVDAVADISEADLRIFASFAASDANRPQLLDLLCSCCQIPPDAVPRDSESLAGFLVAWLKALRGDYVDEAVVMKPPVSRSITPIGFSSATETSGQIAATRSFFSVGVPRIYGVFENHSWRDDLSRVLAVWRDLDQNAVVFQQVEPIITQAAANYVWLSLGQGWPRGHWQLELYDPESSFTLLAKGTFSTQ